MARGSQNIPRGGVTPAERRAAAVAAGAAVVSIASVGLLVGFWALLPWVVQSYSGVNAAREARKGNVDGGRDHLQFAMIAAAITGVLQLVQVGSPADGRFIAAAIVGSLLPIGLSWFARRELTQAKAVRATTWEIAHRVRDGMLEESDPDNSPLFDLARQRREHVAEEAPPGVEVDPDNAAGMLTEPRED